LLNVKLVGASRDQKGFKRLIKLEFRTNT